MTVHRIVVGLLKTNCYVLFDPVKQVAAVIDPGGDCGKILAFLKERDLKLRDIYLTHGHFDHMLAAQPLREATDARVVVHGQDEQMLLSSFDSMYLSIDPEPFRICTPDVRIYGGERTLLGDEEVSFISTPGHSPGSVCIRVENYLFTGDTLIAGTCGRTDFRGGDPIAMRASLRMLYRIKEDCIVYPGHGEPTILSVEQATNPMMLDAVNG